MGPEAEECMESPGLMAGVLPLEEGRASMEGALPMLPFTCRHITALQSQPVRARNAEPAPPEAQ